jgi:tryptophan-rich sensory protein
VLDFIANSANLALLGFIGACFVVAMSGALFKPGRWYEALNKPGWTPPNWLFGPVWMVLYGMIAVSGWLVWQQVGLWHWAFLIYAAQLALNGGWSAVFFGLRRVRLAAWEAGALWLSIAVNIAVFFPIDTAAALLLVPYLCWVTVAFALNVTILRLNPAVA